MNLLLLLSCVFLMLTAVGFAEELMFFSDDHYKAVGEPSLRAFTVNPSIEPGTNSTLRINLANDGSIQELIPNKPGESAEVSSEAEEELHNVDAANITVRLLGDGPVVVTTGPYSLASLPAGETAQLDFNVTAGEGAVGWYNLLLETEYEHQIDVKVGNNSSSSLYKPSSSRQRITVLVLEPNRSFDVEGVVSDLYPGANGTILAVIKNNGLDQARNCSARLMTVPPFRSNSKGCSLGDLQPGAAAIARLPATVDERAIVREYQLACEIIHDNQTVTVPLLVLLDSGPDIFQNNLIIIIVSCFAFAGCIALLWLKKRHPRRSRRIKRGR